MRGNSKKRKHENPLDEVERTLYSSFSTAANRISLLYTQAINQQRKAFALGSKHLAERVVHWLEDEHDGTQPISPAILVAFLRRELEDIEGSAADLAPSVPTAPTIPAGPPSAPTNTWSHDQRISGSRGGGRLDGRSSPQEVCRHRVRQQGVEARGAQGCFDVVGSSPRRAFADFNLQQEITHAQPEVNAFGIRDVPSANASMSMHQAGVPSPME